MIFKKPSADFVYINADILTASSYDEQYTPGTGETDFDAGDFSF